jgi:hypothetical protein
VRIGHRNARARDSERKPRDCIPSVEPVARRSGLEIREGDSARLTRDGVALRHFVQRIQTNFGESRRMNMGMLRSKSGAYLRKDTPTLRSQERWC